MTSIAKLMLVGESREVAASHRSFVRDVLQYKDLSVDLVRRTQYWVYDPVGKTFSPSKFSGYVAMDFPQYVAARSGQSSGAKFDGGITQRAISQVLGDYRADNELSRELEAWASALFQRDALEGIDPGKWRFVRLPPTGAGGLAALAGGWEGSDELVDAVLGLRRGPGRDAPELD